jgi:hypothetical protein
MSELWENYRGEDSRARVSMAVQNIED